MTYINKSKINTKPDPIASLDFVLEQKAKHALNNIVYGTPRGNTVYIEVPATEFKHSDTTGETRLNSLVFKILAVGPTVEDLKPGMWVQVRPIARMSLLDWGNRTNILIGDNDIVWVFEGDPKLREKMEVENERNKANTKKEPLIPESPGSPGI